MQRIERAGEDDNAAREGALPSIVLEITRGRAKQLRREVQSTAFLIGTAPDCDLVLGDPRFPEFHSYLFITPDRVTIRQLAAEPALSVGGQRVTYAALDDLDTVQIGTYEFRVSIEWPQAAPQAERCSGGTAESFADRILHERAIERLLHDVEQHSAAPRLTLFVGDGEQNGENQSPKRPRKDRAIWSPNQRKAIS